MRKSVICLCVILVVVLLVGCETFGGYSSSSSSSSSSTSSSSSNSSSSSSNSSSKNETQPRNIYYPTTYSSKYSKEPIDQEGTIVIYVNNINYKLQRPFELGLKEGLEKKGLKVEVMSDYHYTDDNFYSVLDSLNPKYVLEVVVEEDSVYTYEYGGGISRIGFEVDVYDWIPFDLIMRISISLDGKNNEERYNSSLETISIVSSQEIVEEFCKYL